MIEKQVVSANLARELYTQIVDPDWAIYIEAVALQMTPRERLSAHCACIVEPKGVASPGKSQISDFHVLDADYGIHSVVKASHGGDVARKAVF